jgi:hypothetical protein
MEGGLKKMSLDKEQINILKEREKEIVGELEFNPLRSLENELYEIRDTLSKLENKEPLIYKEYDAFDKDWSQNVIKYGSE